MSDDEKENPFSNWSLYTATPWEMFERRKKHRLFERHGVCSYRAQRGNMFASTRNYDTTEDRRPTPLTTFEERSMKDMLLGFFDDGKPFLSHMGPHVDKYIFWVVTQGKYRSDSNKKLSVYQGTDTDILKFLYGDKNMWLRVDEDVGFRIIKAITETCNQLFEEILVKMTRYNSGSAAYLCRLTNLQNLPEFVQFQKWRKHEHKSHIWYYCPKKQGGKMPDIPAIAPMKNKTHSVHRMLLTYHFWLPSLKSCIN
jgi:hypothetical protein